MKFSKSSNFWLATGAVLICIVPSLEQLKKHGFLSISYNWYSVLISLTLGYGTLFLVVGIFMIFRGKRDE